MMLFSNSPAANSSSYPSSTTTIMNGRFSTPSHQQNPTCNAPNPWVISTQEHQMNEGQFIILRPIGGMIGGEQARPFFLKSGLPAATLAQIWQLSDFNKDGKLDRLEFSVAMKLVRNCLAGLPLPSVLPESMRQIWGEIQQQPPIGQFQFNGAPGPPQTPPQMPPRPMSTYGTMPAMSSASYRPALYGGSYSAAQTPTVPSTQFGASFPFQMGTKEMGDWSLPQPLKLRFCQQFNHLDRSRTGFLTGQQARGVLGESLLPTSVLAQIWNMSDVNKDGCLSIEEFCTAQFLIEMIKSGYALPPKLPNELYSFCNRSKTVSPSTVSYTPTDANAPPPQKPGSGGTHFKTFEDKRKDNLDKGQAELDRRRQILQAEEERRRAEIARREREEAERKERERQEFEQRREAELEAQRQRELEIEKERAIEEERLKAQREEARRRLEMERIKELEKIRIRDLENQLQTETDKANQIQQQHRATTLQIQSLDERSRQLNADITGSRDQIMEITQNIEGMRDVRDEKCAKIQQLERKAKELSVQSERFGHENLQLQSECQRQISRTNNIDELRKESAEVEDQIQRSETEIQALDERVANQEKLVLEKRPLWEQSCANFETVRSEHKTLLDRYNKTRAEVHPSIVSTETPAVIQPPLYEVPPDAVFGSTAERKTKESGSCISSGFDDDFKPDFSAAFGNNAAPEKQPSLECTRDAAALQEPPQKMRNSFDRAPSLSEQQNASPAVSTSSAAGLKTVKYKALYEFNARSADELSLQPGDTILVFEGHQSEPGWFAGQIRDKVGWFPAAFAEPILAASTETAVLKNGGSMVGSPSGEPLASIQEEGSEFASAIVLTATTTAAVEKPTPFVADFSKAFSKSVSLTDTTSSGIAPAPSTSNFTGLSTSRSFAPGALYDLPPGDDKAAATTFKTDTSFEQKSSVPPIVLAPRYEVPPIEAEKEEGGLVLGTGVALYQWKARNEQEMTFARGDIIEVVERGELRWRGRLQKNRQTQGWFPKSYIKLGTTTLSMQSGGNLTAISKSTNLVIGNQINEKPSVGVEENSEGELFIALFPFDAVEPTDLSLKAGDRIWVTDQREQWWRGSCEGRTGIFPANYVQKVSEQTTSGLPTSVDTARDKHALGRAIAAFEATASNQISLRPGDLVLVQQMTPGGWWEGELERNGERQFGWFPGNYIQVLSGDQQVQNGTSAGKPIAVAAFDYQAQHDDELSFKAGDLIEVLDHSDAQWWKGRKQGDEQQKQQMLLFPANFVQLR